MPAAAAPDMAAAVLDRLVGLAGSLVEVSAAAEECAAWTGAQRAAVLAGIDRVAGVLTTTRARWLLVERDAGTSVRTGDADFTSAVARRTRTGLGAATRVVQQAETLAVLPTVADAVEGGGVPVAHLDPLARAVCTASPVVREALTSEAGQARVLALARAHDAPAFGRELARWAATVDPAALERDHQGQRRNRFLHLSDQPDGTRLTGLLDRMAGHRLRIALEATGETPDEHRTPEQARADALLALAEHALAEPSTRPGAAVRPHVSLVLTEETFTQIRTATSRDQAAPTGTSGAGSTATGPTPTGTGPTDTTPTDATTGTAPPATLDDGTPVPMSEVARVLCDCDLTRIVLTVQGTPVDLGRTQRLYTGPQRRAIIVRDQVCAFGECGRAARWCEVHHIRWWDRDTGTTSVDNGVLLCTFHHHEVHRRNLTITRTALRGTPGARIGTGARAAYTFTTPDGRPITGPASADATRTEAHPPPPRAGAPTSPPGKPRPPTASAPPATSPRLARGHPRGHGAPDLFATVDARGAPR